jgi:hypothetical protein
MPIAFIGAGLVRYHQLTDNAHMKVFFGRSLIIGVTCALVLLSPVSARQAGVHSKVPARVGRRHRHPHRGPAQEPARQLRVPG